MKTLLKGGTLLDQNARLTKDCDLLIDGGKIAQMGPGLGAEDAQVVDCSGMVISSGLPVLHAHSPMHILRGLAEDVHVKDWFNREIWPYESKITKEDIYWGTRLCCAEMIDNGVTVFADHYFQGETVAAAVKDAGMRADIAHTAFGLDGDPSGDIAETRRLLELFAGDEQIHIRYGPHSTYICTPKVLVQLVDAAKEDGVGIHIHMSETWVEEKESRDSFGRSHSRLLNDAGGFDIPCIVAHGLWAPEADLELLQGEKTFVASCPKTYMKLGAGKGTIWDHWQKVNLCFGTDGAASSNTVSVLEQARLFALVGKMKDQAEDFRLEDIWRALQNGHRGLNFGTGRLEAGAPADLVVWDLQDANTAPLYNPLAAILYSADRGNVRHTIVGGRFLKKDGKLAEDIGTVVKEATRCAEGISVRGKGESRVFF